MWVVFVVGSRPCSEGFSPGAPVSLPPQKSTFTISNSTRKQWREEPLRGCATEIPIYFFIGKKKQTKKHTNKQEILVVANRVFVPKRFISLS